MLIQQTIETKPENKSLSDLWNEFREGVVITHFGPRVWPLGSQRDTISH